MEERTLRRWVLVLLKWCDEAGFASVGKTGSCISLLLRERTASGGMTNSCWSEAHRNATKRQTERNKAFLPPPPSQSLLLPLVGRAQQRLQAKHTWFVEPLLSHHKAEYKRLGWELRDNNKHIWVYLLLFVLLVFYLIFKLSFYFLNK